mmetsp:Transcript_79234/g.232667  ORF Transcript_79234/g.232667 Transcript_79234/m.232667 type:complete len:236 (+) Transcript_79234:1058-1765(+)
MPRRSLSRWQMAASAWLCLAPTTVRELRPAIAAAGPERRQSERTAAPASNLLHVGLRATRGKMARCASTVIVLAAWPPSSLAVRSAARNSWAPGSPGLVRCTRAYKRQASSNAPTWQSAAAMRAKSPTSKVSTCGKAVAAAALHHRRAAASGWASLAMDHVSLDRQSTVYSEIRALLTLMASSRHLWASWPWQRSLARDQMMSTRHFCERASKSCATLCSAASNRQGSRHSALAA